MKLNWSNRLHDIKIQSLWNQIDQTVCMILKSNEMNVGAFNIFRKSSLKVISEIGIFSEFILQNYFVKYLDSSIVYF